MNAPLRSIIFDPSHEPFEVTVCLWRGAMLDRFARAENTVLGCVRALSSTGAQLQREAFNDGAKARLRALISYLEANGSIFGSKAALKSLHRLMSLSDSRTPLAHGMIHQKGGALEIGWAKVDKSGEVRTETRVLPLTQMLEELSELDKLQRDLASQLGQIRAAAVAAPPAV